MCRTNKKRIVCFFLVFSLCLCSCKKQGTEIILDDVDRRISQKKKYKKNQKENRRKKLKRRFWQNLPASGGCKRSGCKAGSL